MIYITTYNESPTISWGREERRLLRSYGGIGATPWLDGTSMMRTSCPSTIRSLGLCGNDTPNFDERGRPTHWTDHIDANDLSEGLG